MDFSLGYGGLSLSIEGPSKVDINTEDLEDGTCKVTYCPTEPGNYIINIKFADQHVPGECIRPCCVTWDQRWFQQGPGRHVFKIWIVEQTVVRLSS